MTDLAALLDRALADPEDRARADLEDRARADANGRSLADPDRRTSADSDDRAPPDLDDQALRAALVEGSGLPGPRLALGLVKEFAQAVGAVAARPDPPVEALEALLDGWASLPVDAAPGDQPEVILPCAAVAAYGEVGVVRPEWRDDELAKLRRAASDERWRVREVVAQALQRLLEADWPATVAILLDWAGADDPLVVRAAAAAVAEPRLLRDQDTAKSAADIQARAVDRYRQVLKAQRRNEGPKVLRQALGFTISIPVAVTGKFALLEDLASAGDPDLRWIATQNAKKARLRRWPDQLARLQALLTGG